MTTANVLQDVVEEYSYNYVIPPNIEKQIAGLQKELANTSSLELEHREQLTASLTELRAGPVVAKIDARYNRIDMRFMRQLRLQDGYWVPVFAAFEFNAIPAVFTKIVPKRFLEKMSECRIWVTSSGGFQTSPVFFEDLLNDGVEQIKQCVKNKGGDSYVVTNFKVAFTGKFPEETRQKIQQARKLGLRTFVVSEVPNWSITEKRIPIPEDPLVIGYKAGRYWLIDKFDLTPTERWVAEEFTS